MNADMFPEARVAPEADRDRRYTTRPTLDLCMRLAGVDAFDLDVAADEESHHAPRWFGVADDGLSKRWWGHVWCNPPYSNIEPWVWKAWNEVGHCDFSTLCRSVSMLLPCNRTEQRWWQEHVEPYRDDRTPHQRLSMCFPATLKTHFLPGRIAFGHPGNRDAVGVGSPPFGCVLLVWRRA